MTRPVSGAQLVAALAKLGYYELARRNSHVQLRHDDQPTHTLTIPASAQLKSATLEAILAEVAERRSMFLEAMTYLF